VGTLFAGKRPFGWALEMMQLRIEQARGDFQALTFGIHALLN
jgi:hypothetical protein